MATGREIKNRINSVQNTKKITRTMELVSTAKAKRAVDRVSAANPYADKTQELIESIARGGSAADSPLLRHRSAHAVPRVAILAIAANRGLCGGYNNNIVKLAQKRVRHHQEKGNEALLYVAGKKPASTLRFLKFNIEKVYPDFDDKVTFEQAKVLGNFFMDKFVEGHFDRVEVIYTKYISSGRQDAMWEQVLPIVLEDENEEAAAEGEQPTVKKVSNMIFEPSAEVILNALLPRSIRAKFYQAFLNANASEQIARRIAMKNATEAATEMIKSLTLSYNRARQAKITQEIAEIVGGAAASE